MYPTTTVKLVTTQSKEYTIELDAPCYFKDPNSNDYLAVIDEKTAISIYNSGGLTIIKKWSPEKLASDIVRANDKWEQVGDGNFLDAYEDAIKSISVEPATAA